MVYYDILGLFMVAYTTNTAAILNLVSVFLSFGVFLYAVKDFKIGDKIQNSYYFRYLNFPFPEFFLYGLMKDIQRVFLNFFRSHREHFEWKGRERDGKRLALLW